MWALHAPFPNSYFPLLVSKLLTTLYLAVGVEPISTEDSSPMSSAASYPNVPLNLELACTRLLAIYLDDSRTICGHLETFEISRCPPFIALSYEWGPHSPTHDILLHGKLYPIRENLFNAMHALLEYRQKTDPSSKYPEDYLTDRNIIMLQYIWIDFICVNQERLAERNQQVDLMKHIYSRATVVVAWLGSGNDFTTSIMHGFHKYREKSYFDLRSKTLYKLLASFFDLEYFHRLWIVQELVLSQQLIVMCGQEAINGRVIQGYFNRVELQHARRLSHTPGGSVFSANDLTRDLHFIFWNFRGQKCSDARDRVYGLLGIAHAECSTNLPENLSPYLPFSRPMLPGFLTRHDITADYERAPFELFLELVKKNGHLGLARLFHEDFLGPMCRIPLEIPSDLIIPFDTQHARAEQLASWCTQQGFHWEPSLSHLVLNALSGQLTPLVSWLYSRRLYNSLSGKGKIVSTEFLAHVRSLDWTKVEFWPENYRAMQSYSRSRSSSVLVRLSDLERSPMRLVEWATATLGEEMDERLADAIARMAGKASPWRRWGNGVVDVGNSAARLGVGPPPHRR